MDDKWPDILHQLNEISRKLEAKFKDACDIEFTIENGKVYVLEVRPAKRTAKAAVKIALDLFIEGIIDINEALARISPTQVEELLEPEIMNLDILTYISDGFPASGGVASGFIAFDDISANECISDNTPFIFVKNEISPEDIDIIQHADGVLTLRGGMTSHAACICRGTGKPCVSGCNKLFISNDSLEHKYGFLKKGEYITINGSNGKVYSGKANVKARKWRSNDQLILIFKIIEIAVCTNEIYPINVGGSWAIRDFLIHNISSKPNNTSKKPISNLIKYTSFIQPHQVELDSFRNSLTILKKDEIENYKYILLGIVKTLHRLLSNSIGIGNHYKYFRPLFDPMLAISSQVRGRRKQLIGQEFFKINKYVPSLIDINSIKLLIEIEIDDDDDEKLWFLDTTNIKGESLVSKGEKIIGYKILVNDSYVSHEDLPCFYNSFKKREYYWNWFVNKKTSFKEIEFFLQMEKKDRLENYRLSALAHELRLLKDDELTTTGLSIIND